VKEFSKLYLRTTSEVHKYMEMYGVCSVDELCAFLYSKFKVQVIDLTQESEYTQDNAQNSREFADECLTVEDLEESEEYYNNYR